MGKHRVFRAIFIRFIFVIHSIIAIGQVVYMKNDKWYWYLCSPLFLMVFETVVTLSLRKNLEWSRLWKVRTDNSRGATPRAQMKKNINTEFNGWYLDVEFLGGDPHVVLDSLSIIIHKSKEIGLKIKYERFCPSVFLYLASVVPAIWMLELDKVERKLKALEELPMNRTTGSQLKELSTLLAGVQIKLPEISMSTETWITLIEQFLMLILIIGRWMLPKGDLTRDQLSQLLLVYIGTAADIIEFFDSFKDDKISSHQVLVFLTLGIWSWSLMQFTVVLTATKSRKSRLTTTSSTIDRSENSRIIDVCSIFLNIILQDAPFLVFRLLLITHYQIITYMNIFFTCKNTLVILLQIYRLYVVYSEHNKVKGVGNDVEMSNISIISSLSKSDLTFAPRRRRRPSNKRIPGPIRNDTFRSEKSTSTRRSRESEESNDSDESGNGNGYRRNRKALNSRKDTGYSTASSHVSTRNDIQKSQSRRSNASSISNSMENLSPESRRIMKQKLKRTDKETRGRRRREETVSEESDITYQEEENLRKERSKKGRVTEPEKPRDKQNVKRYEKGSTVTASDQSSD